MSLFFFFYLDLHVGLEAIKLVQQLQHGPLHLSVSSLLAVKALGSDGVQLIDEDD